MAVAMPLRVTCVTGGSIASVGQVYLFIYLFIYFINFVSDRLQHRLCGTGIFYLFILY